MRARRPAGFRIHWGWLPAAVFFVVVGVLQYGWPVTLAAVAGGLLLAGYAERRARRRR